MGEIVGQFRDDSRPGRQAAGADREAIEAARSARGCRSCGKTLIGSAAWLVHFEQGEGSRCLPGDAHGQLEETPDGVWILLGSGAAASPND